MMIGLHRACNWWLALLIVKRLPDDSARIMQGSMFKISEFARIACINARLLRHYDDIGLFKPIYIDPENNYRYYSAEQLKDVNRLIVLKELGLSLEQIRRLMNEQISEQEIRGMLIMKKAQVEQQIEQDIIRLRNIENRLQQMADDGALAERYNIVLKNIPEQYFLSIRQTVPDFADAVALFEQFRRALPRNITSSIELGHLVTIGHSEEFEHQNPMDFEVGYLMDESHELDFAIGDAQAETRVLAGCETMATIIQNGEDASHLAFGVLGEWMTINGYAFTGDVPREVYLQLDDLRVIEHQIPVQKG